MAGRVDGGAEASGSSATVFQQVVKDSDSFAMIVALLRRSYLGSVSRNCFQYSRPSLVINHAFVEEYKKFTLQKAASGYTEEELKECFAFLLFDSENQAKLVCQTGLCVGSSTMSTLGDPLAGVYISKYSDYLHPRPWYHGKSGYIVIFKLIKGKMKVVPENYTSKYTAPSPGYDCHVSAKVGKVSAKTSHFHAFELNQYYVYEYHNGSIVQRPRQICPYVILAFQYTEPKRTVAILNDKDRISFSNQVFYSAWRGPLVVQGQLVCDIVLQSPHSSPIPAQLSDKLEVKAAMHVSALKKKLPVGVFEKCNFTKKEAQHQGAFCSLYEVITTSQNEDQLNRLIGKMKEKDLAIIRSLNDQGFLILITSSVLTSGKEFDVQFSTGLLALFIFSSSRLLGLQGRRPVVSSEQTLKRETNGEAISSMMTVLHPGLQNALLKARQFQGEAAVSPGALVEKSVQEFVRLHRTISPPDTQLAGKDRLNLASDKPADRSGPVSAETTLSRLQSYIADPSSYAVEVSQVMTSLQPPAKTPVSLCSGADGRREAVTPGAPVGPAPGGQVKVAAGKAEAADGKHQSSQGDRSSTKETRDELNPRRQTSKRKGSMDLEAGAKRRWSPQDPPSAAEKVANQKGTWTKKISSPSPLGSKKQGHDSTQDPRETTVKLAHVHFLQRRKRGAEVLTAEFVQPVKPESSPEGGASREKVPSGLSVKKAKEVPKPSAKKVPRSKKRLAKAMRKPVMKSKAKGKKQAMSKKQVEPARKSSPSLSNKHLSGSRGDAVGMKKPPKQNPVTMVKLVAGKSSRKNKSVVTAARAARYSEKITKAPFRNSNVHNTKSPTVAQASARKSEVLQNVPDEALEMSGGQSEAPEESSIAQRLNCYESHALNLLADLALSSATTSTMPCVVTDDRSWPAKRTADYKASVKRKSIRTASDHEYYRVDRPRRGGYQSPSTAHRHLPRRDTTSLPLDNSCSTISHISLEHSYTLPFSDHSKKYQFSKGVQNSHGKYRVNSMKAGTVIGRVMPFRHQQNTVHLQGESECTTEKPRRRLVALDKKTASHRSRTVLKTDETFRVNCTWEADYLFQLDSKYTSDPLEKTVNRALHGPWDPDLPDNVEEVKLILHTWVALFYNKPNKFLSHASRKVVEHSNPAKYVSINSTLDPFELLEDDDGFPNTIEACADSTSEAADDDNSSANNGALPLGHSKSQIADSQPAHAPGMTEDINMSVKNCAGQQTTSSEINGHEVEEEEMSLSVETVSSSNECSDGNMMHQAPPNSDSGSVPSPGDFSKLSQRNTDTSQAEFSEKMNREQSAVGDITSASEIDSPTNTLIISLKDNEEECTSDDDTETLHHFEEWQTEEEIVCLDLDSSSQEQTVDLQESIGSKEGGDANLDNKNMALEQINEVYAQEVLAPEGNKSASVTANKSLYPNDLSQAALPSANHNNEATSHKVLLSSNEHQEELRDVMESENMKSVQTDTVANKHTWTSLEDARHSSIAQSNETNQVHEAAATQEHEDRLTVMMAPPSKFPTASESDSVGPRNINISSSASEKSCSQSEGVNSVEEKPVCASKVQELREDNSGEVNASFSELTESPGVPPVHPSEKLLDKDYFTHNNFLDNSVKENEEVCSEKDDSLCVSDQMPQNSVGERRSHPFSHVTELQLTTLEKLKDSLQNKAGNSEKRDELDTAQANMDSENKETRFQDSSSHIDFTKHIRRDTIDQEHEIALVESPELLKIEVNSGCVSYNKSINWESASFRNSSKGEKREKVCDEISVCGLMKMQSSEELSKESNVNLRGILPVRSEYSSEGEGKSRQICHENAISEVMELKNKETIKEASMVDVGGFTSISSVCATKGEQNNMGSCHESSVCEVAELQNDPFLTEEPEINQEGFSPVSASDIEQKTVDAHHKSSVCDMEELQRDQQLAEKPEINQGGFSPVSASEGEQNIMDAQHESCVCDVEKLQRDQQLAEEPANNLGDLSPLSPVRDSEGQQKTMDEHHESYVCDMEELQRDQFLTEEPEINQAGFSPVSASEDEQKTVDAHHKSSVCDMEELQRDQQLAEEPEINQGGFSPVSASEDEQNILNAHHESSVCEVELQSDQLFVEEPEINQGGFSPVSASESEQNNVDAQHESSVCDMEELQRGQQLAEEPKINQGGFSPVSASEVEQKTVDAHHESCVCDMEELQRDQQLAEEPANNLGEFRPLRPIRDSEGEQKTMDAHHESSVCEVELQSDQLFVEEPEINVGGFSPVSSVCASEGKQKALDSRHESSLCKVAELQSGQLLIEEPEINVRDFSPVSSVCTSEGEEKLENAVTELKNNEEKVEESRIVLLESTMVTCTQRINEGFCSSSIQNSSKSSMYGSFEGILDTGNAKNASELSAAEHTPDKNLAKEPSADHLYTQQHSKRELGGDVDPSTVELYGSFVSRIRNTARKLVLKKSANRYPECKSGKSTYARDYTAVGRTFPLSHSVSKYRGFHTAFEQDSECSPLPDRVTDHYGSQQHYINFTVKMHPRESSRTLHSLQGDKSLPERSNQISALTRKWMVTDLTQNTLDLEYLRFIHKLKQVLKSLAPPISAHAHKLLTNSCSQATIKTLALRKGPQRQSASRATCTTTPLVVTLRRSDAGGGALGQQSRCKTRGVLTAPPLSARFQDKIADGRNSLKGRTQTSKPAPSSFPTNEFKCSNKLREAPVAVSTPSGPIRHARKELSSSSSGSLEQEMASLAEIPDLYPQSLASYRSLITDLCSSMCFKLNSVAKDACKKPFMFFVFETGDDPSFRRMKNLLKRKGHTEMEILPFCQAEHLEEDTLIIVIRNEDISLHVHEIPHLLRLKLLPNVIFAGVDSPEDVMNYTYQGLFQSGGFVVSEDTVLETVTVGQLKEVVKVLEKLNETGRWKWLIHYKEDKKLKEDRRVNLIAQKKSFILKSCQQANIVEVLPYHPCDSRSPKKSEELKCLLNLQIQHIGARLALFLTDKRSTSREDFEENGILVADVATFLGTVQRMAAPFRTTYW
ncbi:protein FAM208B isoform X2 [Rhinatrema bivittatum]|uniref:protein FAM208B isoform X2 n=1 Tax=Rhinatrema bivittatum TaxID=194408 RepID=UPI00112CA3C5|nr:protein FAM208B isoform X2 [Rhinatrema bivittatum]